MEISVNDWSKFLFSFKVNLVNATGRTLIFSWILLVFFWGCSNIRIYTSLESNLLMLLKSPFSVSGTMCISRIYPNCFVSFAFDFSLFFARRFFNLPFRKGVGAFNQIINPWTQLTRTGDDICCQLFFMNGKFRQGWFGETSSTVLLAIDVDIS